MKINELKPEFVKFIPKKLEPGILYISEEFFAALHLCCCGCGITVSTPLVDSGWKLTNNNGTVSLTPSIGNFQFPCKSHYWIKDNKVVWA